MNIERGPHFLSHILNLSPARGFHLSRSEYDRDSSSSGLQYVWGSETGLNFISGRPFAVYGWVNPLPLILNTPALPPPLPRPP